jgi:hypothetical protein
VSARGAAIATEQNSQLMIAMPVKKSCRLVIGKKGIIGRMDLFIIITDVNAH